MRGVVSMVAAMVLVMGAAGATEDTKAAEDTKAKTENCCEVAAGEKMDDCCATAAKTESSAAIVEPAALVCTLTDDAKRARRAEFVEKLSAYITKVEERDDGYVVAFENGHAAEIASFIELERECCAFFTFTLTFAPDQGPTTLEISGPAGAKEMLAEVFQPTKD